MFLVNLIFFNVLWFVSLVNSGGDFSITFSEMLLVTADNRELFLSWYVWYVFMNSAFVIYTVLWDDLEIVDNSEKDAALVIPCCRKRSRLHAAYLAFTALFVMFSNWKLVFLFLLFAFPDTGATQETHIWMAAITYFLAILSCICLWIRRLLCRTQPFLHSSIVYFYLFNTLLILAQISLAITFVLTWTGEVEFTLTLLIVLDPLFQVIDHRNHVICYTTLNNDLIDKISPSLKYLKEEASSPEDESIQVQLEPFIYARGDVSTFVKPLPTEASSRW